MKVSIVIPTIGRETLKNALNSALNQTYKDLEIIVTDDTEGKAFKIVEPYLKDGRVKYVINKKYPHGPTGNKNNGLDFVTGDYFTMLDDDDELFPDAVEKLISIAESGSYPIVIANCIEKYTGELTGKHYGKSEEVCFKDFVCGRYEGDYVGIVSVNLLNNERFFSDCWGGESLLWWKMWKKIAKGFYLHKALKLVNRTSVDSVTRHALDSRYVDRTFLTYEYILRYYWKDFKELCPKAFFRYYISSLLFASVAGLRRRIFSLIFYALQVSPFYSFLTLPWVLLCLLLPRRWIKNLYLSLKESSLKVKVKKWLLS